MSTTISVPELNKRMLDERQGKQFEAVVMTPQFQRALGIMVQPITYQRGTDAECRYDMPFLSGFAPDLEADAELNEFFQVPRHKQALGAALRIYLSALGWKKQNRKTRVGGKLFTLSERYQAPV